VKGGKAGGRNRPNNEIADIKDTLRKIAKDVLDPTSEVGRGDAAVAIQAHGAIMNCIRTDLKRREQEELVERLEALEGVLAERKRGAGYTMLRGALRRAEKAAQGYVEWFRTKDGRRYVYSPGEVGKELFIYACDLIRDPYLPDEPPPEEPAFLEAVRGAVDPDEVISRFSSGNPEKSFINLPAMVYGED